ncbi:hydroxymethylbilane synthase [Desulfofundulus thermobenzoicus]|uniref:Porphobilinogen deaminase n=1 Tax=Desulfofundulus thermobenzoicus TaxID=29376 RepID=A0A6N7IN28_9FIRM|nr:hydroxymethylbilane synthase [Desulfofundulus thermobenzoicus]MQL51017.1 hydroxymethylbilane synthase [Desulfofundulus thermobenzoicus]HHW42334.1 hydroxymethylbilane synthase [Desulfotomaculum sp.]
MPKEIVIGTRDSQLAMWQARWVLNQLERRYPGQPFVLRGMKTKGDHVLDVALAKIGDKGLFTKELEIALDRGEIDLAVHSMKDLPTRLPEGLAIGAFCRREYPGDVLISRRGLTLEQLPSGARVGTSSLRRTAQLLHFRPDLHMFAIRGNLTTRLKKLEELNLDALVLAYAGVHRLGMDHRITQRIPLSTCLPAVGQGSIGIEIRAGDEYIQRMLAPLDDPASRAAITAERAMMKKLEGGCQVPIGALGRVENGRLFLEGVVASLDGRQLIRERICASPHRAEEAGAMLAERLLVLGAGEILKTARQEFGIHE